MILNLTSNQVSADIWRIFIMKEIRNGVIFTRSTKRKTAATAIPHNSSTPGDFATIVWNQVKPSSIDEKDAYLCNKHGCDTVLWRKKSKTLFNGWTAFLPINSTTDLSFQVSLFVIVNYARFYYVTSNSVCKYTNHM